MRFNGSVDVGGGRQLAFECSGAGSPTIVMEAGGDSDLQSWPDAFVATLARETTTCRYSRPGEGRSSPVQGEVTMAKIAAALFTALDSLEEQGQVERPFFFVGWSLGGSIALGDALARPDDTAGLAIIDTDFPKDFFAYCANKGRTKVDCQAEYDGDLPAKSIETDIARAVKPFPEIPILVLSAGHMGPDCTLSTCDAIAADLAKAQLREWSVLGPQVRQSIIDGDHDSIVEVRRTESTAEILNALEEARARMQRG
ncbi:MAG TPA: alpha/beta hydrolase [Candidatus Limnocylindria bacterium]|nr:alpha/beta hydrolase [Candidatus Limnocylindria bacterium]